MNEEKDEKDKDPSKDGSLSLGEVGIEPTTLSLRGICSTS